jgi:uncharacterized protein YjhX (UPF0386 family)
MPFMIHDPCTSGDEAVYKVHSIKDLIQGGRIQIKRSPATGTELIVAVDCNNGIGDSLKTADIVLMLG